MQNIIEVKRGTQLFSSLFHFDNVQDRRFRPHLIISTFGFELLYEQQTWGIFSMWRRGNLEKRQTGPDRSTMHPRYSKCSISRPHISTFWI